MSARSRRGLTALAGLLALTALSCGPAARAASLEQVRDIAASGASRLALRLIDRSQSKLHPDQPAWVRWERERIRVLESQHHWSQIIQRVRGLPQSAPDPYRRWARTQLARALLQSHRPAKARAVLRGLLWQPAGQPSAAAIAGWRRLVIRSYLAADDYADAAIAIQRYRHDHGLSRPELRRWQARVLIRGGKAQAAVTLLKGLDDPRSVLLRLRAGLDTGKPSPARVAARARKIAAKAGDNPLLGRDAWRLSARADAHAGKPDAALQASEEAVAVAPPDARADPLFPPRGDLWQLLARRGESIGNDRQLVIGDDAAWLRLGASLAKKHPLQAEAVYAVVATRSPDKNNRGRAHTRLIGVLAGQHDGGLVLQAMYTGSTRGAMLAAVPPKGRALLAEQMIAVGDLRDASRLMRNLPQAPPGSDRLDWQLRRARVLVLAGHPDAGAKVVQSVLNSHDKLPGPDADHLVQVLFDLQAAGRDRQALDLFGALLGKGVSTRQHRRILFWMGDSEKSLGHPLQAARDYLLSATLEKRDAMDDWAQTARYHAARALASGGDLADAARVYRKLLAATSDSSRSALLRTALHRVEAKLSAKRGQGSGGGGRAH
ncbi:MAG TPA: hypothetical protein VFA86_07810 [Gammaproteobacteria bacterium]|nr:hypothetical protein [Gammaproteobacteria bacterium]